MSVKEELLVMGRIGRHLDGLKTESAKQRVVRYCVSVAFDKEIIPDDEIVDEVINQQVSPTHQEPAQAVQ